MSANEPGSDKVTACTRAFEEIDAQVFPGPGRGATRLEAAASDRWGGPSPATVEAYRRMIALVVKHELAHSDPMRQDDRRPPTAPLALIGPRATTLVTPSTKPRSSTGADVPDVSRRRPSRLPRKAST
ncbi:MAG TPA: hypothetical protein VLX59_04295 [Acidimicrobiales bacterium]|nr:hypothetical protein [Acidimicrobiales bacterium]